MKWVTRARPKVDRVACPWLVRRFIDPTAEFLYVEPDRVADVAAREGAIAFDVPGAELGHHGAECSFDAIIRKYGLADPALARLAVIVRGADTEAKDLAPEARGLEAVAEGFRLVYRDDHELCERELPVYDALYAYCRRRIEQEGAAVLFVCLHGAAKSVIAAAYLGRLARTERLRLTADAAGAEPEPAIAPAVLAGLLGEGIDVRGERPRRVGAEALARASRVVLLGCDLGQPAPPGLPVERWDDIPAVSDGFEAAAAGIADRLPGLVARLGPALGGRRA
jgi:protein-tyrosine-phosphatase